MPKAKKSTKTQKYTVLLLYPEYLAYRPEETYLSHVQSGTVKQAIKSAQKEAVTCQGLPVRNAQDFGTLLVIKGHHNDIKAGQS